MFLDRFILRSSRPVAPTTSVLRPRTAKAGPRSARARLRAEITDSLGQVFEAAKLS